MCLALPSLKNLTASMSSHRYSTLCRLIFNPYKAEKRLLCCCAFNLKLFEIIDRVKKESHVWHFSWLLTYKRKNSYTDDNHIWYFMQQFIKGIKKKNIHTFKETKYDMNFKSLRKKTAQTELIKSTKTAIYVMLHKLETTSLANPIG